MRILHSVGMYAPTMGGSQILIKEISERMVRMGHDVTVCTSSCPERIFKSLNGVKIYDFNSNESSRFLEFVNAGKYDIMMNYSLTNYHINMVFPNLDKMHVKKIFVPCGMNQYRSALGPNHPLNKYFHTELVESLKKYDLLISHGNMCNEAEYFRSVNLPFQIIPNGCSEDEFGIEESELITRKNSFRQRYNISEDELLLLSVSSHFYDKGHRELIDAYMKMKTPKTRLIILANSPVGARHATCCQSDCENRIRQISKNIDKSIVLLDISRSETLKAFAAADLFLFTTKVEGSPLVLFEAAAAGLPFISTNAGNALEITEWLDTGKIVPLQEDIYDFSKNKVNIDLFANEADKLLADKELRTRMSENSRYNWSKRFTWNSITNLWENMYMSINNTHEHKLKTDRLLDSKPVNIIIPVFNQLDLTLDCIASIKKNTSKFNLIIVNNGSDGDTKSALNKISGITVINLPTNMGFAGGVNVGLDYCIGTDVIILNNDTLVPSGWIHRLQRAAYSSDDIGMVAPCSNNISQFTYQFLPGISKNSSLNDIEEIAIRLSDKHDGEVKNVLYIAGFCMYVKAAALLDVPKLDIGFGLGNGEDLDFTVQLAANGWRSVVAMDSFVFHHCSRTLKSIGYGTAPNKIWTRSKINEIMNEKWSKLGVNVQLLDLATTYAGSREYLELWESISRTTLMQTGRIKAAKRYQNNKVSIVIPCYNQGEYLEDAVRSVLSQTYKDIEIIIVDDGSTDKTATVANMLISGNNKILFIQHEKNRGLSAARNTGIGRASGRFILPLDADDKISPDCIEKSVTFKNSGTADIVYGICQCFGTANNLWNYKYNLRDLLVDSLFQCSALFEKAHWRECGGYNEQLIKGREDWDFWLRMAEQGHFGYRIEEVLFYYRKKQQSMLTSLLPQYNDITELVKGMHANLFINQSYIPSSNSNKLTINQQIRAIMSERSIPLSQKRIQIGKVRRSVSMEERMRRRY